MQPLNNIAIIDIIDNTINTEYYVKGYSSETRQTAPNQGKIIQSDIYNIDSIIYYHNAGMLRCGDKYAVDQDNIIIADGNLIHPGLLVKKVEFKQSTDYLDIRSQEFFKVVVSNLPSISQGDIIVINSSICYRIMYNGTELFYLPESAILLIINSDGVKCGDNYIMGKVINNQHSYLYCPDKVANNQINVDGKIYYYTEHTEQVEIKDQRYRIVHKDKIIATAC